MKDNFLRCGMTYTVLAKSGMLESRVVFIGEQLQPIQVSLRREMGSRVIALGSRGALQLCILSVKDISTSVGEKSPRLLV